MRRKHGLGYFNIICIRRNHHKQLEIIFADSSEKYRICLICITAELHYTSTSFYNFAAYILQSFSQNVLIFFSSIRLYFFIMILPLLYFNISKYEKLDALHFEIRTILIMKDESIQKENKLHLQDIHHMKTMEILCGRAGLGLVTKTTEPLVSLQIIFSGWKVLVLNHMASVL